MAFEAVFKDDDFKDFLKKIEKKLDSIQNGRAKFISLVGAKVFEDVMDHFNNESGPKGKWTPWSKIYSEHMAKIGKQGNNILQDTGKLRQNFAPSMARSTSQGIIWYNNAATKSGFPYAAAHNDGGPKLPQREFMWLSDKAMEKISQVTLGFLLDEGV